MVPGSEQVISTEGLLPNFFESTRWAGLTFND